MKDIHLFDEITADYGDDYFLKRNLECKCGARECTIGMKSRNTLGRIGKRMRL